MAAHADARDLRVTKQEEEAYYKSARAWDDDRVANATKSSRVAWWVAGLACGVSALLAIAVASLSPLKRVEPYLVRVDSATGIVDNVVRVADTQLGKDEVMNRYFLRRYVTLRQSYMRQELQGNYEQLFLLSAPKERASLKQEWQLGSPTSPFAIYGENGKAVVKITSVSFIRDDIAQVRYYVTETKSGLEDVRHKIATIEFRYVSAPASEEARGVNPLGFQCVSWRADEEAIVAEGEKPR